MAVNVEKDGPVTIVTLSRPEVRNAVDRATAEELAAVFRAFESDADHCWLHLVFWHRMHPSS